MSKKRSEKGSVKALILSEAVSLFTRQGIHGTSLNDIAVAAGLSKGTLYYYYPTKESLVHETAQIHTDAMTDLFFAWISAIDRRSEPAESIKTLVNSILSDVSLCRLHVVLCMEIQRDIQIAELLKDKYNEWSVMLEMGTLRIRPREAETICKRSSLFFTSLNGCMLDIASGRTPDISELIYVLLSI